MSEISAQERGCGKATMYVITEKGLEMGPFMYGKETDSRVLCASTGHIYYSQRKDGYRGTDSRDFEEKRRLRIVDLGNSLLPTKNPVVIGTSQPGKLVFRGMESSVFGAGRFRSNLAIRKSGKARANNEQDKREKSHIHLDILKQVLDRSSLRNVEEKTFKDNDNDDYAIKKENEQPMIRSRQTELKELKLKRRSKDLLEELARWKQRYCMTSDDACTEPELEKREKKMLYSCGIKTAGDRNVLPRLNLPSSLSKRVNIASDDCSKSEPKTKITTIKESSSPRIISQRDSKLIFLNPKSIYSQVKAENTAKLNINESKITSEKPKVRFPSVIDQRTGVMHSVPGVVTYRPCDYNRWSRKNNIVRRSIVHSRSPLMTYVSIFPSIPEK